MIDHIESGGIGGELLDRHAFAIEIVQEPRSFLLAAEAVPHDEPGSVEMAPQRLHKHTEVVTGQRVRA
jgi:hypothetical protein